MGTAVLGSAVLAFDRQGEPVGRRIQQVTLGVNEEKQREQPDAQAQFTDIVDLPKGRNYLYLAVWDTLTHRIGTVNAEVNVDETKSGQ